MNAVTAKPNTINWLATILAKAQGVLNTETGGTVDVGLECANIRREYDQLKAECERYQKALEYIASTGDPGFEVDDKTWWVWGENMRMKARAALVKP